MSINGMLKNKSILLFCQYFFGYENKITMKLQDMGAEVCLYDEMSVKRPIERALLKISPKLFIRRTRRYYTEILQENKDKKFDYVLFIDCEMPDNTILMQYRNTFPSARFCLHMWDSVSNLKGIDKKFKHFDVITTFDRGDSIKYNLTLRPLFYSDEYKKACGHTSCMYDISFIGTIHSDRYRIIKAIKDQVSSDRLYIYPYLQSRFIYYWYKLTKQEFRNTSSSDFKYEKIKSERIAKIVDASNCVLDIQHPAQTGLTMRTLEMVGMHKKIITTNEDIREYDFFSKNNISIVDRDNPVIDKCFISSAYTDIPIEVYEKYSIDQWVLDVLGC